MDSASHPPMAEPIIPPETLEHFRILSQKLRDESIRACERAKATHERFNVFTTLQRQEDEVRLHTRFIHYLLNPDGGHDCGALFLNLFFATLTEHPVLNHAGSAPNQSFKARGSVERAEGGVPSAFESGLGD